MEDLDNIILHSLRELKVPLGEEVTSLAQLGSDGLIMGSVACLRAIDPSLGFATTVPRQMSQRVALCSDMAAHIKKVLGYRADLGYHQFLYPNDGASRQLLRFLVDKLPEPETTEAPIEMDAAARFRAEARAALELAAKPPKGGSQVPPTAQAKAWQLVATPLSYPTLASAPAFREERARYVSAFQPALAAQAHRPPLSAASVLVSADSAVSGRREVQALEARLQAKAGENIAELRRRRQAQVLLAMGEAIRAAHMHAQAGSLVQTADTLQDILQSMEAVERRLKGTKFSHEVGFRDKQEAAVQTESEADVRKRREQELEDLDREIGVLLAETQALETEIGTFGSSMRHMQGAIGTETERQDQLKQKYLVLKETMALLPDADNNIQLLQGLVDDARRQMLELAAEWEAHRVPMVEEYRRRRDEAANRVDDSTGQLEDIRRMREEMRERVEELRVKDERYKQLLDYYASLPKNVRRSVFTRRILEHVKNIKKQKDEINRILTETRTLKKQINLVDDTLSRTFSVTDEMIFADAKKDPDAKDMYRDLVSLRDSFRDLLGNLEATGTTRNKILELETQLEEITQRTENIKVDDLERDLRSILEENKRLKKTAK